MSSCSQSKVKRPWLVSVEYESKKDWRSENNLSGEITSGSLSATSMFSKKTWTTANCFYRSRWIKLFALLKATERMGVSFKKEHRNFTLYSSARRM